MRAGNLTVPLLVVLCLASSARAARADGGCRNSPKLPCIEIGSILVSPSFLYNTAKPRSAVVTVELRIVRREGRPLPPGALAAVSISTYVNSPVNNRVVYSKPETLPLKLSPVVYHFRVRSGPRTVNGYVLIKASIDSVTPGIQVINMQPDYLQWRAGIVTLGR